jgi:hypothetical protein
MQKKRVGHRCGFQKHTTHPRTQCAGTGNPKLQQPARRARGHGISDSLTKTVDLRLYSERRLRRTTEPAPWVKILLRSFPDFFSRQPSLHFFACKKSSYHMNTSRLPALNGMVWKGPVGVGAFHLRVVAIALILAIRRRPVTSIVRAAVSSPREEITRRSHQRNTCSPLR